MEHRRFPMRAVVRRTGLKPDLLRAWERRYGAIKPARTERGRRLYSEEDVRRLTLLQQTVTLGHRIGDVASLSEEELCGLIKISAPPARIPAREEPVPHQQEDESTLLDACLNRAGQLDSEGLSLKLEEAAFSLSQARLIDRLILPLLEKAGDLWEQGSLRIAHEHLLTSVVRSLLGRLLVAATPPESAPVLIAATPAGQVHELGALAAAVTAASEGWQASYLGPNLPAQEILAAAKQKGALAVALSLVYPGDDPRLAEELRLLGRHMPPPTGLLVGGRAASGFLSVIEETGGRLIPTMQDLRTALRALRQMTVKGSG
jgi:MerR family transcriptional regulator, light-induced transcriptional regulator